MSKKKLKEVKVENNEVSVAIISLDKGKKKLINHVWIRETLFFTTRWEYYSN